MDRNDVSTSESEKTGSDRMKNENSMTGIETVPQTEEQGSTQPARVNVLNEIIAEGAKLKAKQSYVRKGLKDIIEKINEIIPSDISTPYTTYPFIDETEEKYGLAWIMDTGTIYIAKYSTWNNEEHGELNIDETKIYRVRKAAEALPFFLADVKRRIEEVDRKTEKAKGIIDKIRELIQ